MKWVPFWFDTNSCFGLADTPEKWDEIKTMWYKDNFIDANIYDACRSYDSSLESYNPNFGTRREHHNGSMTLGEFFDKNGMKR